MSKGFKCHNCGKGIMIGHNVSHAKNRTRKVFKPNLHPAKITVSGTTMRVRLCTKCLRELRGRSTRQLKIQKAKITHSEVSGQESESQSLKSSEVSSIAPAAAGLA